MKIIAYTNTPNALKNAIDKKISSDETKTWEIVFYNKNEALYSHIPEQWREKAMPKPEIFNNKIEFDITWWDKNEPEESTKGYILGRFVEILMVHFKDKFTHLEIR